MDNTKAITDRAEEIIRDTDILVGYSLGDLDLNALTDFRRQVSKRFPEKRYVTKPMEEFLIETGFFGRCNPEGAYYPTIGTVLLFGKYNVIKEINHSFFLDYIDCSYSEGQWRDRLSSDIPGPVEMNIYNFFGLVRVRLQAVDGRKTLRSDILLESALCEALINSLVHADYFLPGGSVKVAVYDDRYEFSNPGGMLVKAENFFRGGQTHVRNEILMKCFRLLGLCQRAGSGGREIAIVVQNNKLRSPVINSDEQSTELIIWKTK